MNENKTAIHAMNEWMSQSASRSVNEPDIQRPSSCKKDDHCRQFQMFIKPLHPSTFQFPSFQVELVCSSVRWILLTSLGDHQMWIKYEKESKCRQLDNCSRVNPGWLHLRCRWQSMWRFIIGSIIGTAKALDRSHIRHRIEIIQFQNRERRGERGKNQCGG